MCNTLRIWEISSTDRWFECEKTRLRKANNQRRIRIKSYFAKQNIEAQAHPVIKLLVQVKCLPFFT